MSKVHLKAAVNGGGRYQTNTGETGSISHNEGSTEGFRARRGLTAPVSLLLILFSLTLVSTVVYNYALRQINTQQEDLKLVAAEEKMLDLEEAITQSAWHPGSSRTIAFSNYGGQLRVEPNANPLQINITLGTTNKTVFNDNTGRLIYELPSTRTGHLDTWLRGDPRVIVNLSTSYQAQMNVITGTDHQELVVKYRPLTHSSVGDLFAGRRINNVRIYIINLNSSQSIKSGGEFYVKASSLNVTANLHEYNGTTSDTIMSISATLNGMTREIRVPITVGASGSTVRIEVVVSHVKIGGVPI
ncbi:MAG: hypothetical protein PVJ38_06260 [Candidatus Bathyarchaeota archaeon]